MQDKILRKLSTTEIGLDPKTLRKEAEKDSGVVVQVMRVLGKISSLEIGDDGKGPWTKFRGFFRYFNLLTGEVFRSSIAFLPTGSDEIAAQFKANREANSSSVLSIGMDFSIEANDFGVGYTYSSESIIPDDAKAIDPLDDLMKMAKALPAPKTKKQKAAA